MLARCILAAQNPSQRITRMSTNPDHKVKLSGASVSRWVSALCLLGARCEDRCGAGDGEGTSASSHSDCVIGPGGGARGQPHAGMQRSVRGTGDAGAAPGGVGGMGRLSSRPPGPPPGGKGSRGADTARRGRPRSGTIRRRRRYVSAARPALPERWASTAGSGSGCLGGGQRATALAATRATACKEPR